METLYKYTCLECGFSDEVASRYYHINRACGPRKFCSRVCEYKYKTLCKEINCKQCNKKFLQKETSQKFCSHHCSATYTNAHKTTGTRVSKLELYLQKELAKLYKFKFKFNSKEEINSELDIYIPSLKLAFELNGIFHYEPIFGQEKLAQIQNNDNRKFQACGEQNISLCIIDTSKQKYFKEQTSQKYLNIIINIINSQMEDSNPPKLS